jgi:tight adherence protein C
MTRALLLAMAGTVCAIGAVVQLARAAPAPARERRHGRWGGAVAVLAGLGRRVGGPASGDDVDARLGAAGDPLGLTRGDVDALKAGGALAALLTAVGTAGALPGRLALLGLVAAPAAGFLGPEVWLRHRARNRAATLARETADVLDLLRVTVDAGLPPGRALAEVGRRHHGLLGGELRVTAERVALGLSHEEALRHLVRRCPVPHVVGLAAALQRAERHGSPLAPSLAALADDARAEHARVLAERAARAAPKIQLVVALALVPSVMLLVAAALLDALTG